MAEGAMACDFFYQSLVYTNSYLSLFSLGLVLPHVHTGKYHIVLTENIMKDDAELRRGVKKVMGVIVGLLKDRVEVDDSPDSKRARTKKFIKE